MLSSWNPLPQLPNYPGPYQVGSCEYEVPVSEIPSDTHVPDASISTIKFRIYYPTTTTARSKTSIPWLPTPQKEGNRAFAKFLGFSERSSGVFANLPSLLSYPTIPAVHNAPLSEKLASFPLAIFSHGLGGNYNTYSSFVGSLASCGMVVVAPEHRDQSAPVTFIRSSEKGSGRPIPYRRVSHTPTVDVLNARNEMLRIRLWELEKLFTVISGLNDGKAFTNHVDTPSEPIPSFQGRLNLAPGKVTWAGHSFGAATTVQFVKSVYYRQFAPSVPSEGRNDWDYTPLYSPAENTKLTAQITSTSPLILLDLWTMPLSAESTKWLWERPLPCFDRQQSLEERVPSNVISIMSTQFYKWPEIVNRTRALLSARPAEVYAELTKEKGAKHNPTEVEEADAEEPSPQLSLDPITKPETNKASNLSSLRGDGVYVKPPRHPSMLISEASTRTPSPAPSTSSSFHQTGQEDPKSTNSSASSLPMVEANQNAPNSLSQTLADASGPQLFMIPASAHLSQSDFGLLFPNVTKYVLKTIEPSKIMEMNVRAAMAMLRNNGIDVANLTEWTVGKPQLKGSDSPEVHIKDEILIQGALDETLWKNIQIAT